MRSAQFFDVCQGTMIVMIVADKYHVGVEGIARYTPGIDINQRRCLNDKTAMSQPLNSINHGFSTAPTHALYESTAWKPLAQG
jgi:hypothetical protein